jgi:chromosome segregation ATPase
MEHMTVTDDIATWPAEARDELRKKIAAIEAESIASAETKLAAVGARLAELDATIPTARAKADALAADAESAAGDLKILVSERDRLRNREFDAARELDKKRRDHAAFCAQQT